MVDCGTPAKSVPFEQLKAPPEDEPEEEPEEEPDDDPDDDPDDEPEDPPDELESSPGPSFAAGELEEQPAMTHVMASAHGAIATTHGKIDAIFMKGHSSGLDAQSGEPTTIRRTGTAGAKNLVAGTDCPGDSGRDWEIPEDTGSVQVVLMSPPSMT
jgi:hypothetical protein